MFPLCLEGTKVFSLLRIFRRAEDGGSFPCDVRSAFGVKNLHINYSVGLILPKAETRNVPTFPVCFWVGGSRWEDARLHGL